MDFISALEEVARLWTIESYPETALIVLAMAPVLLLLWRRLSLVPAFFAEAAITVFFLRAGMDPAIVAAFLIAGNAALAAILLTKTRGRSVELEARLASAEEAIRELQIAEERRKGAMARDIVHQFPGPHRGRASLEVTEHPGHG